MKKDILLFCTCAQNNYKLYLARIDIWYNYVREIESDIYVFVDGKIPKEEKLKRHYLNFYQHENKLGFINHIGWKRSICSALKIGRQYKYIMHIENDVIIFNSQSVQSKIRTGRNICGWVQDGRYMQTAIMALNDKAVNEKIIEYYSNQSNLRKKQCTERKFQTFTNWELGGFTGSNFGIVGRNMSLQTKLAYVRSLKVDYWGQFFYYGFNLIDGKFVYTGSHMK